MGDFEERIARLLEPGGSGRPLTDSMVAEAEAHLRVRLPEDLLALLRIQNGGGVREEFRAYPPPGDHVYFDHVMGIGPTRSSAVSLDESPRLNETWGQPRSLVLLCGDGHSWVALDYRSRLWRRREPRVIFYDNDTEPHEQVVLAPSFRTFVERLRPPSELTADDLPDPQWREELVALAHLLDPPYRAEFRRACSNEAVLAQLRTELADFGHRLDARYATEVDPAEARGLLSDAEPWKLMLFHAQRESFGEVVRLDEGLAILLAGGGGILSVSAGRRALYVSADSERAVLLRR